MLLSSNCYCISACTRCPEKKLIVAIIGRFKKGIDCTYRPISIFVLVVLVCIFLKTWTEIQLNIKAKLKFDKTRKSKVALRHLYMRYVRANLLGLLLIKTCSGMLGLSA